MEARAPLVSIIIATYRAGDYLRQAIESIRAQTCGDFEVLVADDGQDAETRRIVESFADPRLVYESNPATLGPAGNHWAAMRRARGAYLTILNHDDLWKPDFLRRMLDALEGSPDTLVAFCDHDVIDLEGRVLADHTARLSRQTGRAELAGGLHRPFFDLAVRCALPTAQAAVFRRSALDLSTLPVEAGPAYDFWLNYLLARTGGGAYYVPERLASWRTHGSSISSAITRSDFPAGGGACWERIAGDPLFAAFHGLARRQAAACYAAAALADLRGGRRTEARRLAKRALAQGAFNLRATVVFLLTLLPGFARKLLPKR